MKLHAQGINECKREYVILDAKYQDLRKAHLDSCVKLSMQKKIFETEKAAYVKAAKWGKFRAVVRAVGVATVVGVVVGKVI